MATKKTDRIEMSWILAAKPKAVYDAWMSTAGHTAMTGGGAEVEPEVGGRFTAWDGYITGTTKALEKNRRIVQTWRTTQFAKRAPDSRLEIVLRPHAGKTQLTLRHTNLSPGDGAKYTIGWYEHYLRPMVAHFERLAGKQR
jgi:uncharacterized protein YndB with AHSA1/START domain